MDIMYSQFSALAVDYETFNNLIRSYIQFLWQHWRSSIAFFHWFGRFFCILKCWYLLWLKSRNVDQKWVTRKAFLESLSHWGLVSTTDTKMLYRAYPENWRVCYLHAELTWVIRPNYVSLGRHLGRIDTDQPRFASEDQLYFLAC